MLCYVCDKKLINDGELIIKSFVGGTINYVHTECHYQHLLNSCTDKYLEYKDFEKEMKK